jgi:hypothetical protein
MTGTCGSSGLTEMFILFASLFRLTCMAIVLALIVHAVTN